ncbi:hypothetical protein RRG08_030114 [Elysia crispata]|uniref:Uncharacterized protein n=1 Tax=Elysia crispata TaxID=231223 RepID=A0AAE1DKP9_9GAST|nr:hypothetical protein RRG08_030114 [Elysia crispata]
MQETTYGAPCRVSPIVCSESLGGKTAKTETRVASRGPPGSPQAEALPTNEAKPDSERGDLQGLNTTQVGGDTLEPTRNIDIGPRILVFNEDKK